MILLMAAGEVNLYIMSTYYKLKDGFKVNDFI